MFQLIHSLFSFLLGWSFPGVRLGHLLDHKNEFIFSHHISLNVLFNSKVNILVKYVFASRLMSSCLKKHLHVMKENVLLFQIQYKCFNMIINSKYHFHLFFFIYTHNLRWSLRKSTIIITFSLLAFQTLMCQNFLVYVLLLFFSKWSLN